MMGLYSSGALGGVEVLDGGLVGGELTAHVLSAQAAAHAAASAAAAAHQQHQQQQIAVQQIKTSPSSGQTSPAPAPASPSPSKLFVGGLSWQTSSEKLREYFAMFGAVTDVLIMKDPATQLLLECGLIRPTASGLFALLPLARRALDKLEDLVKDHIEAIGGQRLSVPALTAAALWEKSGRTSEELFKVQDRHGKKYLLAPTHEEAIADLLADVGPVSYKQLPLLVYQISDKYRDELRPKHGVLRARAFRMLDAYGACAGLEPAAAAYKAAGDGFRALFAALRLDVHRVSASCGDMGGSESHEWQLPAPAGEDKLYICDKCRITALENCGCDGVTAVNSIEVGHTFMLGTKYSEPLGANYVPANGPPQPLYMTCYGIGITRLLGASLEALSTDTALRWPEAIAPYSAILIGPKEGSKEWSLFGLEELNSLQAALSALPSLGGGVLCDDRHTLTVGKRAMMADKMGYPNVIICGRGVSESPPRFELISGGRKSMLTMGQLLWTLGGGQDKRAGEI